MKKYTLKIEQDMDPMNPREWDNVGTLVCFHNRYDLGDKKPPECADVEDAKAYAEQVVKAGGVVLPLYLYDHSGITISCAPFSCPWDSGQIGFIYATAEKIKAEGITPEQAVKNLQSEVEVYDQYLIGDVYGFILEDEDGEHVASCWGFYGEEEARAEGESMQRYHEEQDRKAKQAKLKAYIKNHVPLIKRVDLCA